MMYTAQAADGHPRHGEMSGVVVHALVDTGHGWADRGEVSRSAPQAWAAFDPEEADRLLAGLGWRRTSGWVPGGGTWFAPVVRS